MRAIDTNVLVRLVARDDDRQTAAAEQFVSGGAWVSHVALVEAVWVLDSVYDLSRERIATTIEMLLDHADLVLQDADAIRAALARFRRRGPPDFSDCMMLELARKSGNLPLGTFDRALARLDGAESL